MPGPAHLRGLALTALAACALAGPAGAQEDRPPPLPYLLRLRPDQAAAYRAYRDEQALERAEGARAAQDASQFNAMTTPQRLQRQLAMLPQQAAQARRQADAVLAFYAQLSPDQRRTFDRVTRVQPPPSPFDGAGPGATAGRGGGDPRSGPRLAQPPADAPLPSPGG